MLIPSSTLEDFPVDLDDCDARSLLAAWTVAWHPRLVAQTGLAPTWYRADAPPEPDLTNPSEEPENGRFGARVFMCPSVSIEKLPAGYADRVRATGAKWAASADRDGFLEDLGLQSDSQRSLQHEGRTIGVADFYAAGYVALQIQILTRRLRYTSNLDQIHLDSCLVEAANAFIDGKAETAINRLHDVFDALAEERDHYFSSDPHLIDLTLVTGSTLDKAIDSLADTSDSSDQPTSHVDGSEVVCPPNVLLDEAAIDALAKRDDSAAVEFRNQLSGNSSSNTVGLACGGPAADWIIDLASDAEIDEVMTRMHESAIDCIGATPKVFARLSGGVSEAILPTIKRLGYKGLIANDFVAGTGFGGESKVMLPCGAGNDSEIEALTAKPIDAASDAEFLDFAAKLGESIDAGEIATGLLVHWPGTGCTSFDDVKRAAAWGVSLGKFWRIDDYFITGERPYHQGHLQASQNQAANLLDDAVNGNQPDAISRIAERFRDGVQRESTQTLTALAKLVSGSKPDAENEASQNEIDASVSELAVSELAVSELAGSIGAIPSDRGDGVLLINTLAAPMRRGTTMPTAPIRGEHVFAVSASGGSSKNSNAAGTQNAKAVSVTLDAPGYGFAIAVPDSSSNQQAVKPSFGKRLRDKFLGKPTTICDGNFLHNEFMEVTIDQETGGIAAVYSGASRGNRFSMRLVGVGLEGVGLEQVSPPQTPCECVMTCDSLEIQTQTADVGSIQTTGRLLLEPLASDENGDSSTGGDAKKSGANARQENASQNSIELASFKIVYTLRRGSRLIETQVELSPSENVLESFANDNGDHTADAGKTKSAWQQYFAVRCAVSEDSSVLRSITRDRLTRTGKRKMVAPLGMLIDEASRKTLIAAQGLPFHKAVGDRFVDSLIHVRGETSKTSSISFGFDINDPVASAIAAISPPLVTPVNVPESIAPTGWFLHTSPRGILVRDATVHWMDDASIMTLRLIQTRSRSETVQLSCFREIHSAYQIDRDLHSFLDRVTQDGHSEAGGDLDSLKLKIKDGVASVPITAHGAVYLAIVFSKKQRLEDLQSGAKQPEAKHSKAQQDEPESA